MALSTGQVLDRRYRIDQLLGQGGFGAVYKAWDISLNGPCAVKENTETSEEAQRQFSREASVLAGLSHPNLPRVIDHFFIPGFGQYLVMDYVEGIDLGQLVRAQGPLPTERALNIIGQVADALIYLHSRRPPVLHRDIKPANIKITPSGRAVLVDFGLVKMYHPHMQTTVGARAITPGYSPPEQYGQGSTDPRTDVYALAATLYTLLTGRLPPESVQRYSGDSLVLPRQVNNNIPEAVSAAVGQAMALRPSQRYQTVAQLRAALIPESGAHGAFGSVSGPLIWIVGGAAVVLLCLVLAGAATVGSALVMPLLFGRATASPAPTPVPGLLLYHDDFSNPQSGWTVGGGDQSLRKYDNGGYVVQVFIKNWMVWSKAGASNLGDMHLEVTASSTGRAGDEGFGLVCRYADDAHYYYLGISPDGYYAIVKANGAADEVLSDPTSKWMQSARIARGAASYRLGADCAADGTLTLYVDGLQVATANDSAYTAGDIGLFVRSFDQTPVEVRFSDVRATALH